MGGEASPPQTSAQISNYPMSCDELQQLLGGLFFFILRLQSQSGTGATRGVSTNFNFFNEMNKVETPIGTNQMPKGHENTDFRSLLAAADGGNMITAFNPITGTNEEFENNFNGVVGQKQPLVGGDGNEICPQIFPIYKSTKVSRSGGTSEDRNTQIGKRSHVVAAVEDRNTQIGKICG